MTAKEKRFKEELRQFDREWLNSKPAPCYGGYGPLPPGDYEAVVIDAEFTESQNGNIGLNTRFEIVRGTYEGRRIDYVFWVTNKSIKHIQTDMSMLGYCLKSPEDLFYAAKRIIHKRTLIHLEREEYGGITKSRVKGFSKIKDHREAINGIPH